ncbi:MAG: type II toxin-antitoxin system RelE/ParE family toxin [Deltaproteobacteria bacterium]|nr:type II toxin-antitoxin system RelE/ParE family toxin [Deltaproteobacteria bacterium]
MPKIDVVMFIEADGTVPLLNWLDSLPEKAQDKCIARIERLAAMGYELRRPEADYLRDGIYELRVALQGIQYRILYFFSEKQAVMSHGLIKESKVPLKKIDLAIERGVRFSANCLIHTYSE